MKRPCVIRRCLSEIVPWHSHYLLVGLTWILLIVGLVGCSAALAPAPAKQTGPTEPTVAVKPAGAEQPLSALAKVRFGQLVTLVNAPVYIAQEKGYFREEGLDVEIVNFKSAPDLFPALATGDVDAGGSAPNAGLYNAILRGVPATIVAGTVRSMPGYRYQTWVVRLDLKDDIKTYADLKGRNVAITGFKGGGTNEITAYLALQRAGLTYDDVNLQNLGFVDINAAMAGKAIDAALQIEPSLTQGIEQGLFVFWKEISDVLPEGHQDAVVMYAAQFTEKRPDVAKRFAIGYIRGLRAYLDAFVKNKTPVSEVAPAIAKYTGVTDVSLFNRMGQLWLDPDGRVNVKSLADDVEWNIQRGYVKEKLDIAKVVDNSFFERAAQQLGRYELK